MAKGVQAARLRPEITFLNPPGQALPCRSVANHGYRDSGVRGAAAVRLIGVPQQPGLVTLGEHGHLAFSNSSSARLVHEQYAVTSHPPGSGTGEHHT